MAMPQAELTQSREHVFHQILSLKQALEWWYCTEVSPVSCVSGVLEVSSDNNKGFDEEGILLAVVDCVSNSAMIRLDMMLSDLTSPSMRSQTESSHYRDAIFRRRKAMSRSLNYVRENCGVAFKPLEFGLQQLWLDTASKPNTKTALLEPLLG
jgi:hypothetical protein